MLRSLSSVLVPLAAAAWCGGSLRGQPGPQPPCGGDSVPAFPALDAGPNIKVWNVSALPAEWKPPACTGWAASESPTVLALAARFRFRGGMEALRRRVGAISTTKGTLYWSATQKRWQTLVIDAAALSGPEGEQRRADFSANEVAEGRTLYFQQEDNLFGSAPYRMRIRSAAKGRLVFDVENAAAIRYLIVPVFDPGQVQAIYYLEQESADVWRYYNIARTSGKAAALLPGHEASTINRAVAVYRHLAGIPTGQEPPAAR